MACQRSRWTYIALIAVSWLTLAMAYNRTFSFAQEIATQFFAVSLTDGPHTIALQQQ